VKNSLVIGAFCQGLLDDYFHCNTIFATKNRQKLNLYEENVILVTVVCQMKSCA